MSELLSQHKKDQEKSFGQRFKSGFSRNAFVVGLSIGVFAASGLFMLEQKEEQQNVVPVHRTNANFVEETLQLIENDYVSEIDTQRLRKAAMNGVLQELDRHSSYLAPEAYQALIENTDGEYAGIGVEVEVKDDRVFIISPIDGSPADKMGLLAGDEIIKINGESIKSVAYADLLNEVRGQAGTSLALTIQRVKNSLSDDGIDSEVTEFDNFEVNLVRDLIPVHSVKTAHLSHGIAYMRISHFTETTATDLSKALYNWQAKTEHASGLILDLRNNPGGLVHSAVDVADIFLEDGLIVKAEGRSKDSNFSHVAKLGDESEGLPIVVLINEATASSAEIVAAALKENDRAIVIGQNSFGKGSVQSVIPMQKGGALKLTTSHYYTPSGFSIQNRGVRPDVLEEDSAMTIALNDLHKTNTTGLSDSNATLQAERSKTKLLTALAIKDPALLRAWQHLDRYYQNKRDQIAMDLETINTKTIDPKTTDTNIKLKDGT